MDSFVNIAGWTQHSSNQSNRPFGHFRSLSSLSRSSTPKPNRHPAKTPSASELPSMTGENTNSAPPSIHAATNRTGTPSIAPNDDDEPGELSTLPDPRSRAMSPADETPELDDEVAALSTKLVNAINRQTSLDDSLSAARLELEAARDKIRELEKVNAEQREMLAGDVWVRRKTVEAERKSLLARIADEKRLRADAEDEKRRVEGEVEALTLEALAEAKKMVVDVKRKALEEQEALQRRNDQLRAQLADTEALLQSQQEQLTALKVVMEHMSEEQQQQRAAEDQGPATAPSSPGFSSRFDHTRGGGDDAGSVSDTAGTSVAVDPVTPTYPTSFTHLIQPVLRTDISLYDDFTALVRLSRRRSASRVVSAASASSAHPSNSSSTSLPGVAAVSSAAPLSSPQQSPPVTPASAGSGTHPMISPSTAAPPLSPQSAPVLRDSKFFKRVLVEDVEPTLRLDLAPGLSWLTRKGVLGAVTDGSLVVEPAPARPRFAYMTNPQMLACTLCGESRGDAALLRRHRFRTSDSAAAQRYPLCGYCVGRMRAACDFMGFLRMVKDGHWRAEGADAERAAWEECVRLREGMFWARVGGGVVPAGSLVNQGTGMATTAGNNAGEGQSPRGSKEEIRTEAAVPETEKTGDEKTGDELMADDDNHTKAATEGSDAKEAATPAEDTQQDLSSLQEGAEHGEKRTSQRLSITIPASEETATS